MILDPATADALARSGWTRDRRVSVDEDVAELTHEGYGTWPSLLGFLAAFSGVQIFFNRNGRRESAWFGAKRETAESYKAWVDDYTLRVGRRLAPIGRAYGTHLLLLAGEDGAFYGGFDDEFVHLGGSAEEMLNALVTGEGVASSDE